MSLIRLRVFSLLFACMATRLAAQCPDGKPVGTCSTDTTARAAKRPALNPRRVIVMPFANLTGDQALAPIGLLASEWITNGVAQLDSLEVVSSAGAIAESENAGDARGAPTARMVAERARAGTVVSGSYYRRGDSVTIIAQVIDPTTGRVRRSFDPVGASVMDPAGGLTTIREHVMAELALAGDKRVAQTISPPRYSAYREYAEGMRWARQANYSAARPYFERAVRQDSSFIAAYSMLAAALSNLGELRAMDSVIDLALDRARTMAGRDRFQAAWMAARRKRDNEGELAAFRDAAARDSTFDAVFLAGWAAVRANHPREAVKAFEFLDHDDRIGRAWSQLWPWYTSALHMTQNYERELEVASRGRALYPDRVAFIGLELRARAALHQTTRVRQIIDSLLAARADSALAVAGLLQSVVEETFTHGDSAAAKTLANRAAVWTEAEAARRGTSRQLWRSAANAWYAAGQLDSVDALIKRFGAVDSSYTYAGLAGLVAARRGDTTGARTALARLDAMGQIARPDLALTWKAEILARLGETREAISALGASFRMGAYYGVALHRDPDLALLKGDPAFAELVRPKG